MSMQKEFEEAVVRSKQLTKRPENEDLLKLYSFFKQATEGDVSGERPGGFDFKGAAKYDAWESIRGMSSEEAMTNYIELVNELHAKE